MDLNELDELFDDNDEELMEYVNNLRTYEVKERIDHFESCSEDEFFNRFRFRKETVATVLLPQIEHHLRHDTLQYHEIDPMTQLLLTLRFYATGSFYITVGDFVGIHKTTAGRIIKRVTQALVSLRPNYVKFPQNEEEMQKTKAEFYELARFPRVVGAIDCTHISIQSPGGPNAEFFRNRKNFFSINVQAVSNANNIIMDIVARWPGSSHDSHIFQNSLLRRRFENGEFGNAVLLGDSGYPLRNYLMTPLPEVRTQAEQKYNSSHISTRTVIERTFGILKRRFPILSLGIRCGISLAQNIIVATAILHNIARHTREADMPIYEEIQEIVDEAPDQPLPRNLNLVQQQYINYFATLP